MDHALALEAQGRTADSILAFQGVLALDADNVRALRGLAAAYISENKPDLASEALHRVLALEPGLASAHLGLGHLAFNAIDMPATIRHFEQARAARPLDAEAAVRLGNAYTVTDRYAEAREIYLSLLAHPKTPAAIVSQALMLLGYDPNLGAKDVAAIHRKAMTKLLAAQKIKPLPRQSARPSGKIRIGYVSSDLYTHVCASFLLPILERHDKSKFEIYCYAANTNTDAFTERYRKVADEWREIGELNDEDAAQVIRDDAIDILVDCNGHTQNNRLMVFAYKPAPIAISYLGYGETTGLEAMDFRFTDAIADPAGESAHQVERLVRLPHCFLTHAPLLQRTPEPIRQSDGGVVVFCSFNNWTKVTPQIRALWAEILKGVPESRLALKDKYLQSPELAAAVKAEFAAYGVEAERIDIRPSNKSQVDHMAQYNTVDIALDPFPYGGGTTSCDALWMGVPVVSLHGQRFVSGIGASILSTVGLPDLIAKTTDDYIARAVALAADVARRENLKRTLRDMSLNSPLGNAEALTRDMEAFYVAVAKGEPPPFLEN